MRAPGPSPNGLRGVLFVCVHNAGRSQMAAAFLDPQFGGSDVEVPVDLERVAVDNLSVEEFGKLQRESALSRSRWAGDRNQRLFRRVSFHGTVRVLWMGRRPHGKICREPRYTIKVGLAAATGRRSKESKTHDWLG